MTAPCTRGPIPLSEWTISSAPAVTTRASATIAAGGAGVRRMLDAFSASVSAVAAQGELELQIRDGATGAGTVLLQLGVNLPVGANSQISMNGLNLVGSPNTAMTIEFSAAPAATNFERVNASGFNAV